MVSQILFGEIKVHYVIEFASQVLSSIFVIVFYLFVLYCMYVNYKAGSSTADDGCHGVIFMVTTLSERPFNALYVKITVSHDVKHQGDTGWI